VKHKAISFWSSLVVYTILYGIIYGFNSPLLIRLLNGEGDPFSQQFFNLMGLFPLYFLFDFAQSSPPKKWRIIPFLGGFLGGAYVILFGYMQPVSVLKRRSWIYSFLLWVVIIMTGWVMLQAFILGQPSVYFRLFFQDALVGIMTVDALVLYGWTIIRAKTISPYWYWSFFPVIGFGVVLWLTNRRQPSLKRD